MSREEVWKEYRIEQARNRELTKQIEEFNKQVRELEAIIIRVEDVLGLEMDELQKGGEMTRKMAYSLIISIRNALSAKN